jgi:hypothetical protein
MVGEAKILLNEQLPKLDTAHKIFEALNKTIKTTLSTCSKLLTTNF